MRWIFVMSLLALGCGPSDPPITADGSTGEGSSTGMLTTMTSMTTMSTMTTTPPDTADTTAGDSSSDDSPVTATDSGTTAATTDATTDSTGGTTDATTDSTGGTTDLTTGGSTDSTSSGGFIDPTTGSSGGLGVDGDPCTTDDECLSNECYFVPVLGGLCGECNEDADCVGGGCTPPNPITMEPAVCNLGMLGDGCETDICDMDLVCAEILSIPGILTASTCSECASDMDCGMDTCQPDYDLPNFTGVNECVMPGSLADGHGCDLITGDTACASGHCAEGDLMGILIVGVCSECEVDTDCGPGETCAPPAVDLMMGLTAGFCM